MATLFLLLILVFIVYPIAKVLWQGYKLQRNWRKATEGMRDAYRRATGNRQGPAAKTRKKKKIDPNIGEYVAFEELTVEVNSTETHSDTESSSTTYIHTESQIEDAVWEDIKP